MPELLEQIFALYRESFPENERRPESDLRAAISSSRYQVLTREQNGKLSGFAMVFTPAGYEFALLEYLAVSPDQRSRGVGLQLVQTALQQNRGRHLLSEVESESNGPDAVRRQRFYTRCGFRRINTLKYHLPLGCNPPPMQLWIHPHGTVQRDSISRDDLARWIRTIYTDVYGCAGADPRIPQMLATLPAIIALD